MSRCCLVTGGAGFIGNHLVRRLLDDGFRVMCLDNLSSGAQKNIEELKSNADFVLVQHDMKEPSHVEEDVHYIFHLASRASPIDYQQHQIDTLISNGLGTFNALEFARKAGARYIASSTSEVYGNPKEHPQKETYWGNVNPVGIRSCYDEGKRVAETLMMDYHRQNNVDIRIARLFNTYGPRMLADDGRVVSNFIVQALNGREITIYGDGSQTRSFCFVDDMTDALIALMEQENDTGPVNLGNPEETTMLELARQVLQLCDAYSEFAYLPLPVDDPKRRRPDITKAKALLGWEPTTSLEDGLKMTIEYFRQ